VTWLLVLFGVGMFLGNLLGGKLADRALMPMLFTTLGALSLTLLLFTATAHNKVLAAITLTLIGALGFATVPPLQKWVLDQASTAPTLASAANIGAFNLGNALAAWLGGIVIAAGLGYTSPNWIGAPLSGTALLLSFLAAFLNRRTRAVAGSEASRNPAAAVGH
jgi:DHA1 family inner membrane transport protein